MSPPNLTEEQIEQIAEKAAEKAIEKLTSHVYQEVGKSVVSKIFYLVGACAIGLFLWMKSKGVI
jgi:tetrahydromethanopterin S-methyltransferase subunit G